jgi:hypothetical protein
MNEIQAINILTNLANEATKGGLFKDINESGAVYTALLVLSQGIPQPEPAPEGQPNAEIGGDEVETEA